MKLSFSTLASIEAETGPIAAERFLHRGKVEDPETLQEFGAALLARGKDWQGLLGNMGYATALGITGDVLWGTGYWAAKTWCKGRFAPLATFCLPLLTDELGSSAITASNREGGWTLNNLGLECFEGGVARLAMPVLPFLFQRVFQLSHGNLAVTAAALTCGNLVARAASHVVFDEGINPFANRTVWGYALEWVDSLFIAAPNRARERIWDVRRDMQCQVDTGQALSLSQLAARFGQEEEGAIRTSPSLLQQEKNARLALDRARSATKPEDFTRGVEHLAQAARHIDHSPNPYLSAILELVNPEPARTPTPLVWSRKSADLVLDLAICYPTALARPLIQATAHWESAVAMDVARSFFSDSPLRADCATKCSSRFWAWYHYGDKDTKSHYEREGDPRDLVPRLYSDLLIAMSQRHLEVARYTMGMILNIALYTAPKTLWLPPLAEITKGHGWDKLLTVADLDKILPNTRPAYIIGGLGALTTYCYRLLRNLPPRDFTRPIAGRILLFMAAVPWYEQDHSHRALIEHCELILKPTVEEVEAQVRATEDQTHRQTEQETETRAKSVLAALVKSYTDLDLREMHIDERANTGEEWYPIADRYPNNEVLQRLACQLRAEAEARELADTVLRAPEATQREISPEDAEAKSASLTQLLAHLETPSDDVASVIYAWHLANILLEWGPLPARRPGNSVATVILAPAFSLLARKPDLFLAHRFGDRPTDQTTLLSLLLDHYGGHFDLPSSRAVLYLEIDGKIPVGSLQGALFHNAHLRRILTNDLIARPPAPGCPLSLATWMHHFDMKYGVLNPNDVDQLFLRLGLEEQRLASTSEDATFTASADRVKAYTDALEGFIHIERAEFFAGIRFGMITPVLAIVPTLITHHRIDAFPSLIRFFLFLDRYHPRLFEKLLEKEVDSLTALLPFAGTDTAAFVELTKKADIFSDRRFGKIEF